MEQLAANIRTAREAADFSVTAASRFAGINRTHWHAYEAGTATPTIKRLLLIAAVCGTTGSQLLKGCVAEE